jgi:transcriptional regulator with XRE-family HTH domain
VTVERIEFSFGRELAASRTRAGLTQIALANELDIDPSTLRNWERGRVSRPLHREVIEQIETLLSVTGKELLKAAGYQTDEETDRPSPDLEARITALENQLELLLRQLLSD